MVESSQSKSMHWLQVQIVLWLGLVSIWSCSGTAGTFGTSLKCKAEAFPRFGKSTISILKC